MKIQVFQPQILRLLKTLEQVSQFNEFRLKSLKPILNKKLAEDEQRAYINIYVKLMLNKKAVEAGKATPAAQNAIKVLRRDLKDIEDQIQTWQCVELRKLGREELVQKDAYE